MRSCPPPSALHALACIIDETTRHEPGHVLIHVVEEDDDLVLSLRPLPEGTHPFGELAGFTAPDDWAMIGLRVRGTARHLEGDQAAHESITTYLLRRTGEECSLLRSAEEVTALPGRAEGTLPDLCRRVLALPTDPPPPSTTALWSVVWLDRIVAGWGDPERRRALTTSWAAVVALHPAATATQRSSPLDHPDQVAALARAHAAAWPWARLRAQPHALPLPDGTLPPSITTWMDDGFFARWAFGAFPPTAALARDVTQLLDDCVGARVVRTLERLAA